MRCWCALLKIVMVLVWAVALGCAVSAHGSEDSIEREIEEQLRELERIKQEQVRLEQELQRLEQTERNVAQEVQNLDVQIEQLKAGIAQSRNRILELEDERAQLNRDIDRLTVHIEANRDRVQEAMVRAYKLSNAVDLWDILLGVSDPAEAEERLYLFQRYQEHENENISRHLDLKGDLQSKLDGVIQRIRLEVVLKEKLVLEDKQVQQLSETRRNMLTRIASDRQQFEQTRSALSSAQQELQGLIAHLQEELRRAREAGEPSLVASLPPVRQGRFYWPVSGGSIVRDFGERRDPTYGIQVYNPGIDIAATRGSNVYAAHDGVVILARSIRGYGRTVLLEHGSDVITMYAHLDEIRCSPGEVVRGGQVVGTVGDSGLAERPMVHFEVRVGAEAREENPLTWLQ